MRRQGLQRALAVCLIVATSGCAPVEMKAAADRPAGETYASAGDVVLKVQRTDNLPNAWGRADLFGRTRDRGFTELRYMGLGPQGMPVFRRRDVEIITNETTMSRTAGISTYQAAGSAFVAGGAGSARYGATGTTIIPATASVTPLAPDTVEFPLDLRQGRTVTVGTNGIEVIEATAAGVRYRAY